MSVKSEKYLRMNKVRAALETGSRSFNELLKIVFGSDLPRAAIRTLQFDLTGLRALGLVTLEGGRYHSTETKTKYRNPTEYKVALKHSRHLMLSTKATQGFNRMNPEALVNRLVPETTEAAIVNHLALAIKHDTNIREERDKYFLSHLKTGYYTEIYQYLLRYREIGERYPKIKQILKHRNTMWHGWDEDEVIEIDPGDSVFVGPYGIPDSLIYGTEPIKSTDYVRAVRHEDKTPVFKEVIDNSGIVREYITIKYDIAAKVYGLLGRVENGVPLEGYCDACPLRHIKIEA